MSRSLVNLCTYLYKIYFRSNICYMLNVSFALSAYLSRLCLVIRSHIGLRCKISMHSKPTRNNSYSRQHRISPVAPLDDSASWIKSLSPRLRLIRSRPGPQTAARPTMPHEPVLYVFRLWVQPAAPQPRLMSLSPRLRLTRARLGPQPAAPPP